MNEENLVEKGETLTPSEVEEIVAPKSEEENDIISMAEPKPRMFTQEEVDRLVGKTRIEAREKALNEMRGKYGVDSDEELDGIFGKGQTYDILDDDYKNTVSELKNVKSENALLKSKVIESRWSDVKAILGMLGLEITPENIAIQGETHKEWFGEPHSEKDIIREKITSEGVGKMPTPTQPASLQAFGNEPQSVSARPSEDDDKKFARLFNL